MTDVLARLGRDVVGRTRELELVVAALDADRHIVLEGPPGTGKSTLLRAVANALGVGFEFVEGNAELTPARLVGTFDPARVRERLAEGWPRMMLAKFDSDQACADFFGRTRQAASYWRSGHCKPDGPALALAWLRWPEECRAMCGEGA